MFNSFFYHSSIRNTVISFGSLFSNIRIKREENGVVVQDIRVPISYAQKEKYVFRREEDKELQALSGIDLPRMSFEIGNYTYDPTRKINTTHRLFKQVDGIKQQLAPVPYNIGLRLHIYTKTQEDALMIMEQVLPLFTPEYNVTVLMVPEMDIKQDVPFQIGNVSIDTVYSEQRDAIKMVVHSIEFTAKINLFGPVQPTGVIKQVDVSVDNFDNTNLATYTAEVIPREAGRDDYHEIREINNL